MGFVEVCSLEELKTDRKKAVNIGKDTIALFYLDGKVYAINGICAHKGGPLCEGQFDDQEIICPWHGFMYNVKTGICLNHPGFSVRKFKTKVDGEKVFVEV